MEEKENGQFTAREIFTQADSLREILRRAESRQRDLASVLPLSRYAEIVFTGCGSSYHISLCAARAWQQLTGRRTLALPSSELLHFPESYLGRESAPLVFAISRSGGTDETLLVVERLRSYCRTTVIAVVAQEGTPLGRSADAELAFVECHERSIVTTQAFTGMLYGLLLLGDSLGGLYHASELRRIPDLVKSSLTAHESLVRPMGEANRFRRFVFLGSGPLYGLAAEAALKMTEMALTPAHFYHTLEFRHGPKLIVSPETLAVILVSRPERAYLPLLMEEIADLGGEVLLIADGEVESSGSRISFAAEMMDDIFLPVLFAPVVQQLAFWRAMARGHDPDRPPTLVRTVKLSRQTAPERSAD
ncbi:MAG TPA: SIS domain-containing protein [Blastocatellia bacterium]|nr:SIS domain-containing protein [Blastocatellia bacterium]